MLQFENRSIEVLVLTKYDKANSLSNSYVQRALFEWNFETQTKFTVKAWQKLYGTRKQWNSYAKLRDINALISDKFVVCVIDRKTKKEAANAKKFQKEFHLHAAGNVPLTWGRKIYICQGLWALITAREQDIAHKRPELRVWCHHVAWWGQRECAPWSWFRKWKRI